LTKNIAKVFGATSSESFLMNCCTSVLNNKMKQ